MAREIDILRISLAWSEKKKEVAAWARAAITFSPFLTCHPGLARVFLRAMDQPFCHLNRTLLLLHLAQTYFFLRTPTSWLVHQASRFLITREWNASLSSCLHLFASRSALIEIEVNEDTVLVSTDPRIFHEDLWDVLRACRSYCIAWVIFQLRVLCPYSDWFRGILDVYFNREREKEKDKERSIISYNSIYSFRFFRSV